MGISTGVDKENRWSTNALQTNSCDSQDDWNTTLAEIKKKVWKFISNNHILIFKMFSNLYTTQ